MPVSKIIIGIDVSPLYSGHKVRGVGFYTERLINSLRGMEDKSFSLRELKSRGDVLKGDYDLLHVPYFHPYLETGLFGCCPKGKPLIVTIHDLIPVKYPGHFPPGIKGRLRWEIKKRRLKKASFILTDSFASKYDIAELTGYPQDRIYVTYLAADKTFRKIKSREKLLEVKNKYRLPDEFVLYVGDINWNKNVPGLVRACELIKIPLVIVGKQIQTKDFDRDHPENQDLVWLQKQIVNSKGIIPLGFVSTEDLVGIYNLASVYCQPSFDEGFGLPVLEAMACGCPVVCSDGGSLPEVAGDGALIVKPDKRDLAKGIKDILKDREAWSKKGFNQIKKFSWKTTAEKTVVLYKQSLKARWVL